MYFNAYLIMTGHRTKMATLHLLATGLLACGAGTKVAVVGLPGRVVAVGWGLAGLAALWRLGTALHTAGDKKFAEAAIARDLERRK